MEVTQAWLHLMTHVIPRFAKYLDTTASQSTCQYNRHQQGSEAASPSVYSCDPRTVYHTGFAKLSCGCVCDFGLSQGRTRFGYGGAADRSSRRKRQAGTTPEFPGSGPFHPEKVEIPNAKSWSALKRNAGSYGNEVEIAFRRENRKRREEDAKADVEEDDDLSDSDSDDFNAGSSDYRNSPESRFVCGSFDNRKLKLLMHSNGINMRYLGKTMVVCVYARPL